MVEDPSRPDRPEAARPAASRSKLGSSSARGRTLRWSSLLVLFVVAVACGQGEEQPAPAPAPASPPEFVGRVLVGYQGWFTAEGDGTGLGFRHWGAQGRFEPGACSIDLWPDPEALAGSRSYVTPFRHADGRAARVFSSADFSTVRRHFGWMQRYRIGGAILQRFVVSLKSPRLRAFRDRVLDHVRRSSAETGVPWALMYDLSGAGPDDLRGLLHEDMERIEARTAIARDGGYLHHRGRPLIGIWGAGFADGRAYSVADVRGLVDRLQSAGWAVLLGVPFWWRDAARDAVDDPQLRHLVEAADVVSPWSVGRFADPAAARRIVPERLRGDIEALGDAEASCPVVFPGFSWHNLKAAKGQPAPLDEIPRRGGAFLRAQIDAALAAGARSLYVAMFDELDEATAIMPVARDPPLGLSPFLSFPEEPRDLYLEIVADAARRLDAPR